MQLRRMRTPSLLPQSVWILGLALALGACGEDRPAPADTCSLDEDCLPGQTCILGHCATERRDMGRPTMDDAGADIDAVVPPPDPDGGTPSGDSGMELDMGPPRVCGDESIDFPEDCDPPNPATCTMRIGCSSMCTIDIVRDGCGNGCEDPGEECGDVAFDCGLTADCVECQCVERCGNGMLDTGETCGEPGAAECAAGEECRNCECYTPACLNGIVDSGEECNEPGLACPEGATCEDCRCLAAGCGNGVANPGEDCGEPVFTSCPLNHDCIACVCTRQPMCGDGSLDPGEECETLGPLCGAGESCVGCQCERTCGDGTFQTGEVCGEPVLPSCDPGQSCVDCACNGRCGNGTAELGEKCGEPGLTCAAGATCDTATCSCNPLCGNAVIDAGEMCDPPTTSVLCSDTSICNGQCQLVERPAACGNGCGDPGEDCQEGPMSACMIGQHCASCECVSDLCGNGTVDSTEPCDGSMIATSATCPDGPGGASGGTPSCTLGCTLNLSSCRCGARAYTVDGELTPFGRRDVWELPALNGARITYRIDTTGSRGFDPVACISTTPSSADCFARSDDGFDCTAVSSCGTTGCPQGIVTMPPDPDQLYYLIVESYTCGSCFAQDTGTYSITVEAGSPICAPRLTDDDVCEGSGDLVPGEESCACP